MQSLGVVVVAATVIGECVCALCSKMSKFVRNEQSYTTHICTTIPNGEWKVGKTTYADLASRRRERDVDCRVSNGVVVEMRKSLKTATRTIHTFKYRFEESNNNGKWRKEKLHETHCSSFGRFSVAGVLISKRNVI